MVKNRKIGIRMLRLFAISWSILLAWLALILKRECPGSGVWIGVTILSVTCLSGLFFPAAMRRPYHLVEWLFRPVGELVSLFVMAVVFFGVFTPFAAVLRLTGWSPLALQPQKWGRSAWKERTKKLDAFYWQY